MEMFKNQLMEPITHSAYLKTVSLWLGGNFRYHFNLLTYLSFCLSPTYFYLPYNFLKFNYTSIRKKGAALD